jgi:hypothetical protein
MARLAESDSGLWGYDFTCLRPQLLGRHDKDHRARTNIRQMGKEGRLSSETLSLDMRTNPPSVLPINRQRHKTQKQREHRESRRKQAARHRI